MPTNNYKSIANLKIHSDLYNFIDTEVIPGLDIKTDDFFSSLAQIHNEIRTENTNLLKQRDHMQEQINTWHIENKHSNDFNKYKEFLQKIGYLLPEPNDFQIEVAEVDDEIAKIAAPQLVVPVSSRRFAINAINARWGSLYDALYGTDVIENKGALAKTKEFNHMRAQQVIQWSNEFLDIAIPIKKSSYSQLQSINIVDNQLEFTLTNGNKTSLQNQEAYIAHRQEKNILLKHNNLHIELQLDAKTNSIKDVILESAVSTIIDFEDSVTNVSSAEKIKAYRNFLGLINRDLNLDIKKDGKTFNRSVNKDKTYITKDNKEITIDAISLILVRNVGIHMFSDIITDDDDNHIAEGLLDAMITTLISIHDINNLKTNSKKNSIYIVKPKLHGPAEVAFSVNLFTKIEQALGLSKNTIKIGIMDEERRTSINLKACIKAAKNRVIFINTGFLDRTGDEIHTNMLAGAIIAKDKIKTTKWIAAYEALNVETGLNCGFYKQAQIGKGMWAQPDQMQDMINAKSAHLKMGANCSWVPSPTAATLHVTHYHKIDVFQQQQQLINKNTKTRKDDLLVIPTGLDKSTISEEQITTELNNNAQSILGYVVKWIDQGIGCSKVADINNIGLMEDRATLRISSQHVANWLHHKICTKEQVQQSFKKMAIIVDKQNKNDPRYIDMAPKYTGNAFMASLALVFEAEQQANGYTEATLVKYRRRQLAIK